MVVKLPVNGFMRVEEISQFNKDFIESYHEESDEGYFLEVDVQYPSTKSWVSSEKKCIESLSSMKKLG